MRKILCHAVMALGLSGCDNEPVKKPEQNMQQTHEEYGTVEKETVEVLVAKFNTEVMDNGSLNPASNDYSAVDSQRYWYALASGVDLVVIPQEFKDDPSAEIVDYMVIFVEKGSENEADASEYVKFLIKANNSDITDAEIDTLMQQAREKAPEGNTADSGKGISVGYIDNEDNYQYQVIRLYE